MEEQNLFFPKDTAGNRLAVLAQINQPLKLPLYYIIGSEMAETWLVLSH